MTAARSRLAALVEAMPAPRRSGPRQSSVRQLMSPRFRARRGDVRAAAMLLLDERARDGYQLMQRIKRRTHGAWRPGPGSIYPTLRRLLDESLIAEIAAPGGRVLELTATGHELVTRTRPELEAL
jgi:DNA-binding PadR family transcriptional regulator